MAVQFETDEESRSAQSSHASTVVHPQFDLANDIPHHEAARVRLDFMLIGTIAVLTMVLAMQFDAMEAMMEFAADHEEYEVDEIFMLTLVLAIAFGIFSWRRVRDLQYQIDMRNRAECEMRHLAFHDALTGMPNRAMFAQRLKQEISRSERDQTQIAILALDLDHFKNINDYYGHVIGDAILVAAARRIKETVRGMDTTARLGGDEFAIIQPQLTDPDEAAVLASRIVRVMAEPFDVRGHRLSMSVSVGITMSSEERRTPEDLLRAADVAMYRSKTDGRATYTFFEPEMEARLRERRDLEQALRQAPANGEFEVYFQPLYTVRNRRLKGFEALLRWDHPTLGHVPPETFIPIAEDIGLIRGIGEWVLAEACNTAANWPDPLCIGVNVSPVQFRDPNLAKTFKSIIERSGLAPQRLEVEITESVLMKNTETVLRILDELKDTGIRISMDDFGTGYSSLSYLRKFPFDKIKIDRSFVSDVDTNAEDASIVRAIIAMGQSLGMLTLAEGVESDAQLQHLKSEGCEEAQGFLLGRPMPAVQAADLIAHIGEPDISSPASGDGATANSPTGGV